MSSSDSAVLVGDEKVGLRDDVHAKQQVVIINVRAIDFMLGNKFAVRKSDMYHICVGFPVYSCLNLPIEESFWKFNNAVLLRKRSYRKLYL